MKPFLCYIFFQFFIITIVAQNLPNPFASYTFSNGSLNADLGAVNGFAVGNISPAPDRFGNENEALAFSDGSAVSFGDNFDIFSTPDAQFSFSLWLKNMDLRTTNVLFLSKYGNSNCGEQQREFILRFNDNRKIEFLFYSELGVNIFNGFETIDTYNDTCWHHIIVNYDGSIDTNNGLDRVEIYIDGELKDIQKSSDQSGMATDIANSTSHLSLGTPLNSNGGICFFNSLIGLMDDIHFFDETLSLPAVQELYTAPSPSGSHPNLSANFLVSDSIICANECLQINDQSFFRLCNGQSLWSFDGGLLTQGTENQPETLCFSNPGTYQITHIVGNDFIKDTIVQNIQVIEKLENLLGSDTILCENTQLMIEANPAATNYLWSTGATTSSILIDQEGLYWLEFQNNSCVQRDSIIISGLKIPDIDLGPDERICPGENLTLNAASPLATSFQWQDGSTASSLLVDMEGLYIVEVSNECGSQKDSLLVSLIGQEINVDLGNDRSICENDTVVLNASNNNAQSYLWSNGSTDPILTITTPGIYRVTVSNGCFEVIEEVLISNDEECCNLFVPNVFSPNGDGINESFRALTNCSLQSFQLKIFNRWGGMIFQSNDVNQEWNGRVNNQVAAQGVYTWIITYNIGNGDQLETGTISLIR